ncbi:MAG: PIN domain-containing protein [Gammaproteobacteria bacterium]|nr:PIN domain-containing protein [Gammaproteobacteria bacterium]MDE0259191.1 PIN domain-containing protein [Gammaproteobacteria bacterium]
MIVADTSALLGLLDRRSRSHGALAEAFHACRERWVLPWAILPELDYMIPRALGAAVYRAFQADLEEGCFAVEWGGWADVRRALELDRAYGGLSLGLVDGVVMAVAERLEAEAIATLDLRDFGAVNLKGGPAIWPRDLR